MTCFLFGDSYKDFNPSKKRCKHEMLHDCQSCFTEKLKNAKKYVDYCFKVGAFQDEKEWRVLFRKDKHEFVKKVEYAMEKGNHEIEGER